MFYLPWFNYTSKQLIKNIALFINESLQYFIGNSNVMGIKKFDIGNFLTNVFLFKGLKKVEIDRITKACSTKRYKKNTMVFSQGTSAEAFYIVINGKISIFRVSTSGGERIIHIHDDGDMVAEASIFDKAKYPANCRTLKESLLLRIPRLEFINILLENPKTSIKIMSAYSKRLRELVTMVEYLSLDDVKFRILRYFQKHLELINDVPQIKLKITKKEMAYLLGTVPETLSRNLRKLREDGIISEKNGLFRIENINKFKQLIST